MSFRLVISALFLLALPWFGHAQFVVQGVVSNQNGEPIEWVEVHLNAHKSFTNAQGEFQFLDVPAGEYELIFSAFSFQPKREKIKVSNKNVAVKITLLPQKETLKEVVVTEEKPNDFGRSHLKNVDGSAIYASKKSEVIELKNTDANLATNNSRQIYAKVAGLNIWENDGAGIQLGIGGRGLNPNRVSNFNTRQNGYDISADALGYPESYYSPASEAIERIEIVRGAASLQYGTQFGGFVNFKLKQGATDKKVAVESRQTLGSFGLFNTFNSIGGTTKNVTYYGYYQYKTGNGWRQNSGFDVQQAHANVQFKLAPKLKIGVEYTYMYYLAQQAGGLTDAMFAQDPQQSIRDRNWFNVNWNLAAVTFDYKISTKSLLNGRVFGLMAGRDALGFLGKINRADPGDERNLLKDEYKNIGAELRFLHRYSWFNQPAALLIGTRYYQGFTHRQQGFGTDGSDANFGYVNPENVEYSEYTFPSQNVAVFAENVFHLGEKWSVTPGARFEYINTNAAGYYNHINYDLAGNIIYKETVNEERHSARNFVLAGIGASYKPTTNTEFYGNISQNYRSINFNDMRIVNPNYKVDPNLQDERGYNADLGVRGSVGDFFTYDISGFLLRYQNRIGEVLQTDSILHSVYRFRTNVSDSRSLGIEMYGELDVLRAFAKRRNSEYKMSIYSTFSVMDAVYLQSEQAAFEGNKVELVPPVIVRSGVRFGYKSFSTAVQFAFTDGHFTDATNTQFTADAVGGWVPAYSVFDWSANYRFKKYFTLSVGINNALNNMYFTRRAAGYPGPGILPSDARSFYATLVFKL